MESSSCEQELHIGTEKRTEDRDISVKCLWEDDPGVQVLKNHRTSSRGVMHALDVCM